MIKKITNEFQLLFSFKGKKTKWQKPLLTTFSIGLPLLLGLYFDNLQYGLSACLSGLIIIYLPESGTFTNRILTLLICSFGFMVSSAIGYIFSFKPLVSIVAFGVFSMTVHWITLFYKTAPPRSFFFILIAAMTICQPFDIELIPIKVGLMALGTMLTLTSALIYLFILSLRQIKTKNKIIPIFEKNTSADIWETLIYGAIMSIALAIGHIFELNNPYWIPISSAAVMQGASLYQIRQRMFQRILGTFVGIGFTWVLFYFIDFNPLLICVTIIILQLAIEMLIVKQYAVAVVFITPFTILLNEAANPLFQTPNTLIALRLEEIIIGSILGAIGGWLLYKEKIRYASINKIESLINNDHTTNFKRNAGRSE
ncbi:FUSC family protein [Mangrovimonas cancribranchiae]|uniref:FUSC family protein n=1 Tax=Mangrovimonas cancribranchiae TaxID=3080055 RepID=A0AAU6NXI7_9FLAO